MGCDIHGYFQKRYAWPKRDPETRMVIEGEGAGMDFQKYETIMEEDIGRNYFLFALLAGVRNSYELEPISEPRGLPDDLGFKRRDWTDDEPKQIEFKEWDFGDHSQSWVNITEVIDWVANNPTMQDSGYVDRAEYEACVAEGRTPESWCGGIWGNDVIKTTHEEVVAGTAPKGWTTVHWTWHSPTLDRIGSFYKLCEYLLARYGDPKDPGSVRFVFGFDS